MDSFKRLIVVTVLSWLPCIAFAYGEATGEQGTLWEIGCVGAAGNPNVSGITSAMAGAKCAALRSIDTRTVGPYRGCTAEYTYTYSVASVQVNSATNHAVSFKRTTNLIRYLNPNPPAQPCNPSGPVPADVAGGGYIAYGTVQFVCADGSTPLVPGSRVCQCNLGLRPKVDGGKTVCEVYSCPPAGTHAGVQPDIKVEQAGQPICRNGCVDTPSKWKVGADNAIWAVSPYKATGEFCGGAKDDRYVDTGNDKTEPPPVACGDGLCPGTVNGGAVCVACKSESAPGPSEAASGVTPGKDPDGTIKKSDKETSCSGNTCTTTTTHKDGAGNVVGTETKTEPKESFCQQNPGLSICKEGSFGGSCGGSFNCQGDAVQCAIAREIHTRGCQLYDTPNAFATVGESVMNSQAVPSGHPGGSPGQQDMSSMFRPSTAVGACLVDKTVVVGGRSLVLPFSQLCDPLRWLGYIAYAFSLIHAVSILLRKI